MSSPAESRIKTTESAKGKFFEKRRSTLQQESSDHDLLYKHKFYETGSDFGMHRVAS